MEGKREARTARAARKEVLWEREGCGEDRTEERERKGEREGGKGGEAREEVREG